MRLLLCVVLLLAVSTGAQAAPLEILGGGVAWVQPFADDEGGHSAAVVHMQLLDIEEPEALTLATAPNWTLSRLTLDALITEESISPALSFRLTEVEKSVPVYMGIVRESGQGWGWYIEFTLVQ